MTTPIRGRVFVATEFSKPEKEFTLREAIEWFKQGVRAFQGEMMSALETKYMNERWSVLCDAVAEREGVPTGALSYFLGELAQAEMAVLEEASLESEAAQMYQP